MSWNIDMADGKKAAAAAADGGDAAAGAYLSS